MMFIESQDPAIRKEVLKTEPPIEKLKIYTSWISAAAFENIFVNCIRRQYREEIF